MKFNLVSLFVLVFLGASMNTAPVVFADEAALLGMVKQLEKQMGDMQNTINWQNDKIKNLENKGKDVRVVPSQASGSESKALDLGGAEKWLKDLKFSADFRLRYEALSRHTASDRNRFRYRLRFGFEKKFEGPFEGDKMKVGFRIVSAGAGGRDSTNTTLDTNFAFKGISIDRAYAKYYPKFAQIGPIKELEIAAGKFANPFSAGSTWMLWDSDVQPEGAYQRFTIEALESDDIDLKIDATLGQLILEEGSGSTDQDAELFAYQLGILPEIKGIFEKPIKTKHYISWYQYSDFNLPGNFAAAGANATGTGNQSDRLATGYDILNIYNEIGLPAIDFIPQSKIYFDWFTNVSEGANDSLGGGEDMSWMIGAKLGKAKKKGTWEIKYEYAWNEQNSNPDVFSDSDWGSTGRRGSIVKGAYAITDDLKLKAAMLFTNRINTGDQFQGITDSENRLFQVDLVWKW